MSIFSSETYANRTIRAAQIITAALALGLTAFASIAIMLGTSAQVQPQAPQPQAAPRNLPLVSILGLVFTVIVVGAREVVAPQTVRRARLQIARGTYTPMGRAGAKAQLPPDAKDADRFLSVFMAQHVLRAAMAEGPAFFTLIAFIVDRQWWVLIVPSCMLALIAMSFPGRDRVESWVTHQLELLSLER